MRRLALLRPCLTKASASLGEDDDSISHYRRSSPKSAVLELFTPYLFSLCGVNETG